MKLVYLGRVSGIVLLIFVQNLTIQAIFVQMLPFDTTFVWIIYADWLDKWTRELIAFESNT